MAFFDDLKKNLSTAADIAVDKAKDLIEKTLDADK